MTCLFYLQARATHHPFRRCRPASEVETVNQQAVVSGLDAYPLLSPAGLLDRGKVLLLATRSLARPGSTRGHDG
jgi:hypothetical protein